LSAYRNIETKLNDKDCLMKALEEEGYHPEYHPEAENLIDYVGKKRPDKAEIIVRRREMSEASNDMGFKKDEKGVYKAIISDYDSGRYNAKWLKRLTDKFAIHKVKKIAKNQGLKFVSSNTAEDGTTKMIYESINA
jgi:hypothetical protein